MKKYFLIKKVPTIFLRLVIVGSALVMVAAAIFVVPSISRDFVLELPEIKYLHWPFLVAAYGSILAFELALVEAFKILIYIDHNLAFSSRVAQALRRIKDYLIIVSAFLIITLPIFFEFTQTDDAPGVVLVGMVLVMLPFVVVACISILLRLQQKVVILKKESEIIDP